MTMAKRPSMAATTRARISGVVPVGHPHRAAAFVASIARLGMPPSPSQVAKVWRRSCGPRRSRWGRAAWPASSMW